MEEKESICKYEDTVVQESADGFTVTVLDTKKPQKITKENEAEDKPQVKLYKRRFLILGIFCIYSMSSAFQWMEYAIIANIIVKYYKGTSMLAVQWTSMIYMLSYIPLMFVATWMLDKWGLRKILLVGSALNAIGSLIKIGSVNPNLFALSFFGQTIAACAQSFILEIPPKIASVYFGPTEVSTATSMGVFGNQLGVALGFVLPPLMVPLGTDDEIASGLRIMFISSAAVCTLVVLLIFLVIKDEPPLPPSKARAISIAAESSNQATHATSLNNYKLPICVLMKDMPFLILLISYGINTGTYYAIGTLLNQIIEEYHENAEKQIGEIGLTMVVAGLGGSVICGLFLDKTKLYKSTTVGIYVLSLAFMCVFSFTLNLSLLWLDYVTIGLLGFFMTGYLPIGFEFAAEITFPESEATSSGLLNVSAQIFGIVLTLSSGQLLDHFDAGAATKFMSAALLVGTILTVLIKSDLKRQNANYQIPSGKEDIELTTKPILNANCNSNNNTDQNASDDTKLIRLTSVSSCYSTGLE
ncbi:LOW QUALITY PROTEIN: choline/ethanolamine transporter flvcr2a [Ciona intestinalis]